jgi:cellobiose-specific phosphotransferase system component IIC
VTSVPSPLGHIFNMAVATLSYGMLSTFLVVAILLCALRYAKAPARYASAAALFTGMLCMSLVWPLAKVWFYDLGVHKGVPINLVTGVSGVVEISFLMAIPTLVIIAISVATDDP